MSLATSQEISPRISSVDATVRVLPGPAALTPFEAVRLAERLRGIDLGVRSVEAGYLYLLKGAGAVDEGRLMELLGRGVKLPPGPCVWIGAEDGNAVRRGRARLQFILHNTGFVRVERD